MINALTKDLFCSLQESNIILKRDSTTENIQGYTEYKIIAILGNYEHHINRRFSQFKEFDKSLKYHLQGICLPSLPSKFMLMNKTEQRKKGFNLYLIGLVQLAKELNIDQRVNFMRLLAEFLELEGTQNIIEEEKNRKTQKIGISELIPKPNTGILFTGLIDMKTVEVWQSFYGEVRGDAIYLYPSNSVSFLQEDRPPFIYAISLFLGIIHTAFDDVLELHHDYQDKPIFFKSPSNVEFKKALFIACSSKTGSPLSQLKKKCVGRVSVTIHSGHNIKIQKPPTSVVKPLIFITLELDCLNFSTEVVPQENDINWGQTFIM